jgi:predicted ester cyclase
MPDPYHLVRIRTWTSAGTRSYRRIMTETTEAETIVRRMYEPLTTGDTALVDEALAPDWEAVPPMRTGPRAAGWKATIDHLRQVFTDLTVSIEDVVVSGDLVAVRSVSRGTHTGELLGVPGTGRPVEVRAADFHRLAGGRIVRTWHLEDYFGVATQLGLKVSR